MVSVFGPLAGSPARPASSIDEVPALFRSAIDQLRRASPRADAVVEEVPAPVKLAPYSVALGAEIADHPATGRFILLHDPAGQQSWGGTFRVVIYIRAELEPEMGNDPLLASVAWTWLSDSLAQHGVNHSHAGGTATRILSESFGALGRREATNDVELRASWTPEDAHFGPHLEAWADMVCSFAGLPPLPDGVVALPHIRRG